MDNVRFAHQEQDQLQIEKSALTFTARTMNSSLLTDNAETAQSTLWLLLIDITAECHIATRMKSS